MGKTKEESSIKVTRNPGRKRKDVKKNGGVKQRPGPKTGKKVCPYCGARKSHYAVMCRTCRSKNLWLKNGLMKLRKEGKI